WISMVRSTLGFAVTVTYTSTSVWLPTWVRVIVPAFMWDCKGLRGNSWLLGVWNPHKVTPMYAEERQQVILERARARGRVDVAALAEEFVVTTEPSRRDLTVLERHGVLRRVHGGAIPVERLGFEPALSVRETVMTDEKERIARAALAELPEAGTILLDAG